MHVPAGRILLWLAFVITGAHTALAQSGYSNWQQIYTDGQVTLSIGYKESGNSCTNGGRSNKYAFRIEGTLYGGIFNVYSVVTYTECNGRQQTAKHTINLGQGGTLGLLEGTSYNYRGSQFKAYAASTDFNHNPVTASTANTGNNNPAPAAAGNTGATPVWEPWIKIYTDKYAVVSIRYKISPTACTQGSTQNKYKFKVEGSLRNTACELPVQVNYTNCQNNAASNYHRLRLGPGGAIGEIESIDYRFVGAKLTGQSIGQLDCNLQTQQQATPQPQTQQGGGYPVPVVQTKPRKNPAYWGMWFKTGLDMGTRPLAVAYSYRLNSAETNPQTLYVVNPLAVGWRGDLEYSPIFLRGFGLSFNAGGAYGLGVSGLAKLKPKPVEYPTATVNSGSINYSYYKLDFGAEMVFGWEKQTRALLLLTRYQVHVNSHTYKSDVNYTASNGVIGQETKAATYNNRRETIYAGIRFRPNTPKFAMDVTFQLSKDYNWGWGFGGWNYTPM
ncbi:MAG TPA: hypothetical protein PLW44_09055, partial [Chitinophagales bacterium]|nr:hypothetical protein [Chitinophagales bacterium]